MDKDEKINYKSILLHEIHKVLSYDDAESGKYTNKDYVRKINDWAKLKEFSEHIKVVEIPDDEYKEFLTRKNMSGYKIYIEKLEIIYSRECAEKGSYNFTFDRNKIVGITNESYEQVDFDIHLYI
ncbi:MAG: hypothetical protein K0U66_01705, partial [Gammaproteobacteria bacterium]|nr:hypothetical protein [Gammaproteobacteria bacterium]